MVGMRVRVIGAGIVGLACAVRLREAGHDVDIVAAEVGEQTTSAVAAAIWYPYRALPEDAVTRWAAHGFRALEALSADPASGVDLRMGRQLCRTTAPDPWWVEAVPRLDRVRPADLPAGYVDGFELTVPVVDMAVHLRWLTERLAEMAVGLRRARLENLTEAHDGVDAVVNCAGLGARDLVGDTELVPVRGQVVLVEQFGLRHWMLDELDPTYVVPRRDTVVLGGTAVDGDEDCAVRPDVAQAILRRAVKLVPGVASARVVGHRVGLRPGRSAVRLEIDPLESRTVHCYGHGGAGVTLAYGCAEDVVRLIG
ncbi:MAG: amino acid oxidase [Pseudonocardiales bacterium]|nr:MAG: amino acid oxidase [Pseudonocardiales bacterium]